MLPWTWVYKYLWDPAFNSSGCRYRIAGERKGATSNQGAWERLPQKKKALTWAKTMSRWGRESSGMWEHQEPQPLTATLKRISPRFSKPFLKERGSWEIRLLTSWSQTSSPHQQMPCVHHSMILCYKPISSSLFSLLALALWRNLSWCMLRSRESASAPKVYSFVAKKLFSPYLQPSLT